MNIDSGLASEQYCYLTTTGRVSGRPHTMEIWFGIDGSTLYMLPGGRDRSDWVKNLQRTLEVALRIADRQLRGQARVVHAVTDAEEDALARRLLMEKYAPGYERDLGDWERTALPVAVDLSAEIPAEDSAEESAEDAAHADG